ncbi:MULTISPECIES: photosystem I reaction center subunit IX [Nostocales]|uniref:Photosystem I reaction center subunit IX n=1 Tax=Nodularia spumigena PCC 73104 TaxID=128405 RepID=A0A2L2FQF5_NODSP|nr:photosystem I reaction center subunit IX [Nodularia sphaerocarpa]AVG72892.1 photosystem I reaction center subunit IX [Nodularia spumigena PCC 73104]MDP5338867.1 photosystem I reaction center subunit IX [Nodularia sp. (in: cyanobacteria)]MDB9371919.1 photosystem I reaction center subunit IX [Nodularia sphaerocarpa CS-585]MDB9379282.1 photosystem I reaction center subunit IX [Nodularia sphaerocarpa CS-585A2]ULP70740.1 Photosystem I reaction center subunit IX [Nodularia sphaerocarpa UHCC 0038]
MAEEKGAQSSYFITFLSTAPVAATIWLTITAGILIEFNRFFPDLLFHPLP